MCIVTTSCVPHHLCLNETGAGPDSLVLTSLFSPCSTLAQFPPSAAHLVSNNPITAVCVYLCLPP